MPRLMSVAMTADAVIARQKTVTRRKGWLMLKPGDRLTLCRKVQGRKHGEPLERLAEVEVVSVRRESLRALTDDVDYGLSETSLEGMADWARFPSYFVEHYFVRAQGMALDAEVTRIEWRYLDQGGEQP